MVQGEGGGEHEEPEMLPIALGNHINAGVVSKTHAIGPPVTLNSLPKVYTLAEYGLVGN